MKSLEPIRKMLSSLWSSKAFSPLRRLVATLRSTKTFKFVEKLFRPLFRMLGGKGGVLSKLFSLLKSGAKIFKPLLALIRPLTPLLKVIGWPVTILMGLIGAVKGFFKGAKEGGWKEAILQGFTGLVDGLIGWAIDLGADLIGWLIKKFGGDEVLAQKFTDFDFFNWFTDFVRSAVDFFVGVGEWATSTWSSITTWFNNTLSKAREIWDGVHAAVEGFTLNLAKGILAIKDYLVSIKERVKGFFKSKITAIKSEIERVISYAVGLFERIAEVMSDINEKVRLFIRDALRKVLPSGHAGKTLHTIVPGLYDMAEKDYWTGESTKPAAIQKVVVDVRQADFSVPQIERVGSAHATTVNNYNTYHNGSTNATFVSPTSPASSLLNNARNP